MYLLKQENYTLKRISSFILIMMVLSSSLAFCCEQEELCDGDELITCENETPKSHEEDFPCSPFFECGNCTGNIIIDSPLVFQNTNLEPRLTFTPFIELNHKKDLHYRLLKPPMQIS